jgi:vancomycin resistance protein VanJ
MAYNDTVALARQTNTRPHVVRQLTRMVWLFIQVGIVGYGMAVLGYLLLRVTAGEQWNIVALANNFAPWITVGALVPALIAVFSRRRWALIALQVPSLIAFVFLYGDLFWPRGSVARAEHGIELTVATYNMLSGESDPARVIQVIDDLNADVIGLEELGPTQAALITQQLAEEYPYRRLYTSLRSHGVGLLSRYPILEERIFSASRFDRNVRQVRIVLDVGGTPVTVYVSHPHSPGDIFPPTAYDTSERDTDLAVLREQIENETNPTLVVCDCNMTDQSDAYRLMDKLLTDSFREAGWGFGFTFPAPHESTFSFLPTMIRIDYVWHSAHFTAYDAYPWDDSGTSDHLPMVAELVLKTDTGTK